MNTITNVNNVQNSLQISKLENVPAGEFKLPYPALIKNITENGVTVEIKLPNTNSYISTVLYPGWNVELVTAIKGVVENQLQYGC